jgi:glutamate synthase domain-containing protein 2
MRKQFIFLSIFLPLICAAISFFVNPVFWFSFLILVPLIALGYYDLNQKKHAINRIFPIIGHARYLLEEIRPEINQYFIESNHDGRPFSREQRSVVYQRAKNVLDTLPFGTQQDVYASGYEWLSHSLDAKHLDPDSMRIMVGSSQCSKPYNASLLNISAMSYGSLSKTAIESLSAGAALGNFAHNTGEGGISPYHKAGGADLIWQIGTGYFGCRTPEGGFCEKQFAEKSQDDQVKMIELKLSQGAKPGHGGILPAKKVTKEISEIRSVPMGEDVLSPPAHKTFDNPIDLMKFIQKLRELSGGKPVGFKISIGNRSEFIGICKAIVETGIIPDFIAVDGGEGGTGAAPLEFTNHMGEPGTESVLFVSNILRGFGLREQVRVIATGKISDAFDMIKRLAIGADLIYSARAMMLAIGCIQALRCNTNICPTGVATTDPNLYKGIDVNDKKVRVYQYHKNTIKALAEVLGAMGLERSEELRPWHIKRRVNPTSVRTYFDIYTFLESGQLLNSDNVPEVFRMPFFLSSSTSFKPDYENCKKHLREDKPELDYFLKMQKLKSTHN